MLIAIAALVAALGYVELRRSKPEWKRFQEKGFALSMLAVESKLAEMDGPVSESPAKREELVAEVRRLRDKKPAVIEIRPFGGKLPPERCLTCHSGIEDISSSHPNAVFGCVICHGGNGPDLSVSGAHIGLRGGRNPARLDLAPASCGGIGPLAGKCHAGREHHLLDRAENVARSLMATNAGIVNILRFQWGLEDDAAPKFAIKDVSDGKKVLRAVPPERSADGKIDYANSHFRKFCAACHLWTSRADDKMGSLEGCPACHAPYSDDGRYRGGDPTVNRNDRGHATTHTLTNRIPDRQCRSCHNRSARVGLNYHGEMESAQYGTPFMKGGLNDYTLSDDRFVLRLVPDIHQEKGMACIDCHTAQDTMGDGEIHAHMEDQVEIRCEDCHGSPSQPPRTVKVGRGDVLVQALNRSQPFGKAGEGDEILLTSKGRPMPHVKKTPDGVRLTSKLTGKEHPVKVITGKADGHAIKGHERMECDACHSAWSPQCYGCHQMLDFGQPGYDHISKQRTPGRWAETRSYFRFFRNILGINSRGKVGVLVPGCQVWNTVVDEKGAVVPPYDSKIMDLRNGMTSIAMGPTHPHTTRTEAPRCLDCHLDSKALGLGEGRLRWSEKQTVGRFEAVYDSRGSGLKMDFPPEALVDAAGRPLQSTSHRLARPFNQGEIQKITNISPCLTCHDKFDDPAFRQEGSHRMRQPCREFLERR